MEELDLQEESQTLEKENNFEYELVVMNDEINTFDHVILSLIDICGVEDEHAIQCTLVIHNFGEAVIVEGEKDELTIMEEGLNMVGIDAIVRKKENEE
jgi:ATP-dependent Clp protease adaptor protein ClpS